MKEAVEMKRVLLCSVCLLMILGFAGCRQSPQNQASHTPTVIRYPQDNSVNGYRLETPKEETVATVYIGNRNSKKFHLPDCESVSKMKAENKVTFQTRNTAISQGYAPCSVCNP